MPERILIENSPSGFVRGEVSESAACIKAKNRPEPDVSAVEKRPPSRYCGRMFRSIPRSIRYWLPPMAWAAVIFTLSSLSFASHEPTFQQEDKFFHAGLFALLSMLLFFALSYERRLRWAKAALLAVLITSAFGALDEFHQRFTPNRSCDVRDWMADTAGAAVVLLTGLTQRRKA
jgi:VanZ family protein